jgi:transposase
MNKLCPMPGCRVERVMPVGPDLLHVTAHGTRPGGRCPDCGRASRAVHSYYHRRPADLSSLGSQVRVGLRVRRFYCRTPGCARRTFAERLPELVAPRARRTRRLAEAQGRVGVASGGRGAARLLAHLAMPASTDTVLRLVRRLPLPPEHEAPRVVGVDDWAVRKGRTYGTIVVDLERRHVLDLLPDRAAETLADWLRQRPSVQVVARDRSTEYARGIALGAPAAVQVADRWHLLANMRQVLERWLAGAQARLRRLPVPPGPDALAEAPRQPALRTEPFPRSAAEVTARVGRRARKGALYGEVRRRRAAGETLLAIGRAVGLAVNTVRKYASAESFPVPEAQRPWPSILDPHLAHLQARFAAGCGSARRLWRELRAMGFPGTDKQVQRWLAQHRTAPAAPPPGPGQPPALPPATQLSWLLIQPPAALSADDAATTVRIEQDGEAASVAALARRFTALVRACGVRRKPDSDAVLAALDARLADARACGVRAVETFAAGLKLDGAAVRAALTTPWSSGQAEGQITRLKLIKRQSYGRAGFDLLRRRVLLAA